MGHAAYAKETIKSKPMGAALLGFGWIYFVTSISNNRANIEASLAQGSLPEHLHTYIFGGLAVLLAASVVLLGLHLMRYVFKRGARRANSGGILFGALGALMLFYTPTVVWQEAFGMLDGTSQSALLAASTALEETLPGIGIDSVAFVSSNGW